MLEMLRNVYALVEQVSVTALIVASVVFTLAFLFAVREAASWFFKIDDIKRDVRKLHEVVVELEAEVRTLQSYLAQAKEPLKAVVNVASESAAATPTPIEKKPAFPITH